MSLCQSLSVNNLCYIVKETLKHSQIHMVILYTSNSAFEFKILTKPILLHIIIISFLGLCLTVGQNFIKIGPVPMGNPATLLKTGIF